MERAINTYPKECCFGTIWGQLRRDLERIYIYVYVSSVAERYPKSRICQGKRIKRMTLSYYQR